MGMRMALSRTESCLLYRDEVGGPVSHSGSKHIGWAGFML